MILADTHAWIFYLDSPSNLSTRAQRALNREVKTGGRIGISAISLWEIGYLEKRGRLSLSQPLDEWIGLGLQLSFVTVLAVDGSVAQEAARLPDVHRDPADRFILATARLQDVAVVSADKRFADYPGVKVVW